MYEEDVAADRLRKALAEQERQTTRYQESVGTTGELSAYARLQAANLAVANCDRMARGFGAVQPDGAR
jgi:hypothetical protein